MFRYVGTVALYLANQVTGIQEQRGCGRVHLRPDRETLGQCPREFDIVPIMVEIVGMYKFAAAWDVEALITTIIPIHVLYLCVPKYRGTPCRYA